MAAAAYHPTDFVTRLVTPVEVSLWTTITALMACRDPRQPRLDVVRIDPVLPIPCDEIHLEFQVLRYGAP